MLKTIGFVALGATLAVGAPDPALQFNNQFQTLMELRSAFRQGNATQYAAYYLSALDVSWKNYIDTVPFDDWSREDLKNMVQLYTDYRNAGREYIEGAELIGLSSIQNTTSSDSSSSDLQFTPLGEELVFDDIWQTRYDDESVRAIKDDLSSNGGTILYEVEAFYDYMFGPQGVFTLFYQTYGRGQPVDTEREVPTRYQDYYRYIFATADSIRVIGDFQTSYLLITQKAAALIEEDQNENVTVPDGDQVFTDNLMELVAFNDMLTANSTSSQ